MKIKLCFVALITSIMLISCNSGNTNTPNSKDSNANTLNTKLVSTASAESVVYSPNLQNQYITASYEQNGILYVGTNMGLYISEDNGNSWTVVNPKDTGLANSNYIYDVAVDGSTVYMLVGYNNFGNYTLVSKDGGKTWQHFGTNYEDASSMFLVNHDLYLVYGGLYMQSPNTIPTIKISHDQGNSWTTVASFANTTYITSLFVDKTNINNIYFIAPSSYLVYGSQDGGKSWKYINTFYTYTSGTPTSVVAKGNTVFIGTDNELLYSNTWLDNSCCGSFSTGEGLGSNNIYKLTIDADNDKLFVATKNGYSLANNISLTPIKFNNYTNLPNLDITNVSVNSKHIIVGTTTGIFIYNNSNKFNWTSDTTTYNVLSITSENDSLYGVNHNGMYMENSNSTNTMQSCSSSTSLDDNYTLSIHNNGNTIYAGSLGGISISKDGGNSWYRKSLPDGAGAVTSIAASGNDIYAGTYGNDLNISHDGGSTWSTVNLSNSNIVYSVFIDNGVVYAGTKDDGLLISTDKGNSWKQYFSDITVKNIFVNNGWIYIATYDGLYISTDGAKNWSHYFDNKKTNSVFVSAGNIYVGFDDGSIAVSIDGKNFTQYSNLQSGQTRAYAISEKNGTITVGNNSNTLYGIGN